VKKITVLYDARCGFCVRCRDWLLTQPSFVEIECLFAGSSEAARRFPGLVGPGPAELLVVSEDGGVYRGASAWIVCLWALREWREWSLSLADPALFPFARRFFDAVSASRGFLSRLLGLAPERAFEEAVELARRGAVPIYARRGELRCGYCHDGVREDARTCPGCRSVLHEECRDELGRCPTLGCRQTLS
jgi:predicted DCC family thiol-disulfide oxidoreductase YuxK